MMKSLSDIMFDILFKFHPFVTYMFYYVQNMKHLSHIMFYYVQNFTPKGLADFQVVKNSLNPEWKTFEIKAQKLCAANYDVQLKVYFIMFILFY